MIPVANGSFNSTYPQAIEWTLGREWFHFLQVAWGQQPRLQQECSLCGQLKSEVVGITKNVPFDMNLCWNTLLLSPSSQMMIIKDQMQDVPRIGNGLTEIGEKGCLSCMYPLKLTYDIN